MASVSVTGYIPLNDTQGFRATVQSLRHMVSFICSRAGGKRYLLWKTLSALLDVPVTLIYVLFPGYIITELSTKQRLPYLAFFVSVLVLSPVLVSVAGKLLEDGREDARLDLSRDMKEHMESGMAKVRFDVLESPAYQDMRMRTRELYERAYEVVDMLVTLLVSVVKLFTLVGVIVTLHIGIILLIVVVIALNAMVTKKVNSLRYRKDLEGTKLGRYLTAFFYVFYDPYKAKEIRLYQLGDFFSGILNDKRHKQASLDVQKEAYSQNAGIFSSLTGFLEMAIVYAYIIWRVLARGLEIGSIAIYIAAVNSLTATLSDVMNRYLDLSKLTPVIREALEFEKMTRGGNEGKKIPVWNRESVIEFCNVSFRYPGTERYVIRNLSLMLHGNEKLCLVGENGAGKTTLVNLLLQFYLPDEGKILLNGIDIREYDRDSYWNLFSVVLQENQLLSPYTVGENITLCVPRKNLSAEEAAEKVTLMPMIRKLKKGLDTQVGKYFSQDGTEPSGGESARISIARAMYHDRDVFILDEPTAALDPLAEYEIYTRFHELAEGKCAVMITHRLSSIQFADRIAVMEEGSLIAYGTHEELYESSGVYRDMFDKQAEFYRDTVRGYTGAAREGEA